MQTTDYVRKSNKQVTQINKGVTLRDFVSCAVVCGAIVGLLLSGL